MARNLKSFRSFTEENVKPLVVTFGRFNPPTTGHAKLIDKVASLAQGDNYRIYPSHSQDPEKNPLSHEEKVKFMRKMFPKHGRNIISDPNIKTMIDVAASVDDDYTKLIMVVGDDRVPEFKKLLTTYNGKPDKKGNVPYDFTDGIEVVSAGERDPDADDVTGMSASKMRAAAADNDLQAFVSGLPKDFGEGKELFNAVRKGMGLEESYNFRQHVDVNPTPIRERYLMNKIFNLDDRIKDNKEGRLWTITERHNNFIVAIDEEETKKFFLHDIKPA